MKIALVHELLTMRGGAERVLKILANMFPEAPIYTLLYDESKLGDWFPRERVRTPSSRVPYFPRPLKYNHHLYLNQFPKMIESFDFSQYDVVLSVSSAFAHGIITNGNPKHVTYINAPARYLWDRTHDVQEQAANRALGKLKKKYLQRTFHKLRTWDSEAAARADHILTASKDVSRRVELYWRRESDVVYPPIDDYWMDIESTVNSKQSTDYFLIASTLVPYKKIDLAIQACQIANVPLKIIGEGPDRKRLEQLATNNQQPTTSIEFLGYTERDTLRDAYAGARALIFPGVEDFGIAPLEAMACGTPVISYRAGGPLETIIEHETGCFFDEPTAESLAEVLKSFDRSQFDPNACMNRAREFSRERFESRIREAVT